MERETYKGRKLKVVKGRGNDWGYSLVTMNGTEVCKYLGDEAGALASVKGTIDHADEVGLCGRYTAEWYAPGTYELCENGHVMPIGGECGHEYCVARRPAQVVAEPELTITETTPQTIRLEIRDQADNSLTFAGDLTVYPWHIGPYGGDWALWLHRVAAQWVGRTMRNPTGTYRAVATEHGNLLSETTFTHRQP